MGYWKRVHLSYGAKRRSSRRLGKRKFFGAKGDRRTINKPKNISSRKRGELIPPSTRKTAIDMVREFRRYGIKYVVAGAIPVQYYGRERLSRDVDFVLSIDRTGAEGLFKILKKKRYKIITPKPDEISSPSSLLSIGVIKLRDEETGSLADIILRSAETGFHFDEEALRRVRRVTFDGEDILIPSPEDYLIMKLKTRRPGTHDFEDIMSTLTAQFRTLDWEYLKRRAREENLTSLLNYYRDAVKWKLERHE
jgi:predicted nucleotidyltransferase